MRPHRREPDGNLGAKITYQDHDEDKPLNKHLHTAFRGSAARSNYLSADRLDCQDACKEVCRSMSSPTEQRWKALNRLGRYLCGLPPLVYTYRTQEINAIDVYVDTDWAWCMKTRKSTSGGAVMLGKHTIKHWSSTQPSVSLSSGEAEFYGVVRGTGQGLGYQSLLKDLGLTLPLPLWTNSSAAMRICSRQGLGKLLHLDTHTLWVQQAVRRKRIDLKKVLGEENPADLLTKHSLSKERVEKLVALFDCQFKGGRAEAAHQIRTGLSDKKAISQADAALHSIDTGIGPDQTNGEGPSSVEGPNPASTGEGPSPAEGLNPASTPYEEYSPRMPYNHLDAVQLELQHPSLEAIGDLDMPDLSRLEDEQLYAAGMNVVQGILLEMSQIGRTRKQ